ncbi:hypothetical protein Tco_1136606 [Tanacetum coccineum]
MLYCVVIEEQYNLAYFFVKRIECARANPTANLPNGMFLTRLYRHIMEVYPHLDNGIYDIVDRVMRPLALKQTRRPRSDRDNASMDITLTLSPNTPLDVQFDTPSPSPPIIAHPIPWNFLEAHETIARFLGAAIRGRATHQGGAFVPSILLAILDDAFLILQKGGEMT